MTRRPPCTRGRALNRSGLSLLEMLLAVGLALVLVGGIYSAIDQSARQTTIGRVEMERLQIGRAVLRRIELDVRATMFASTTAVSDSGAIDILTDLTSTSTSSSSSGDTSDTEMTSETIGGVSDEDEWTGSLGIRGSATELWIDLSHMRRPLDFSATTTTGASDLKTVAYFLTNSDTEYETDPDAVIVPYDPDGIGLARSEGERSVLRTLNASSGDSVLPGPTQLLAPEISQLQFRYFDGLAWYEEWDSSTIGYLPRAVEVTIGFGPPEDMSGYLSTSEVSSLTQSMRLVIAVPASDPLSAEEG